MTNATRELERRVEAALHERAAAFRPAGVLPGEDRAWRPPRRAWRVVLAAAAVVALAVVVGVAVRPLTDGDGSSRRPRTEPTTMTTVLPAAVVGPEVPLTRADTFDTRFLMRPNGFNRAQDGWIALQIPGFAPIIARPGSMVIAYAPADGTGYQGAGVAAEQAATKIVGTTDTGANEASPTKQTYGAWTAVPDGTVYVTFTNGDDHAWQRPIDGISYFAVGGSVPPGPVVYRAYDAAGNLLGEARP